MRVSEALTMSDSPGLPGSLQVTTPLVVVQGNSCHPKPPPLASMTCTLLTVPSGTYSIACAHTGLPLDDELLLEDDEPVLDVLLLVLLEVLDELDAEVVLALVLDAEVVLELLLVLDELLVLVLLEELPPSGLHASATREAVDHLPLKQVTISFGNSWQTVLHSNTLSHRSLFLNGQLTLPPEDDELLDVLELVLLDVLDDELDDELEELDPPSGLHASATMAAAAHLPSKQVTFASPEQTDLQLDALHESPFLYGQTTPPEPPAPPAPASPPAPPEPPAPPHSFTSSEANQIRVSGLSGSP